MYTSCCCLSTFQHHPTSVNNLCITLLLTYDATINDVDGQLKKDKSSERKTSGVLPEEATHFSDAADKIVWTKYGGGLKEKGGSFVPARVGK